MANDGLAAEIVAMADEDQRFRRERSANAPWDPSVDQRNTQRIREIVSAIGWPTVSKVGADAEHKAWLLVQHADLDFQRECFALMVLEPASEVCPKHLAYLEDRIRVREGRSQRYGTQLEKRDEAWEPLPVDDPQGLDARRQAVGLEPITEYLDGARRTLG